MKVNKYGQEPLVIDEITLAPSEMCFVQYLPIVMKGLSGIRIPANLRWVYPLLGNIDYGFHDYVYLTVKHLYVTPSNMGNRPGWHSDGFGTDDINYIWCDKFPTEFCIQGFTISEDCGVSLMEMEQQSRIENVKTYGENILLRLDKFNIHRTPVLGEGYRTFIKISVSREKYNLKGNAHNYLFDYDWKMIERGSVRNHPHKTT